MMGPFDPAMSAGSSSSSSSSAAKPSAEIDGLLARAGYVVRSSDLRQIAQRLERLETVIGSSPATDLASDPVLYNPSDIGSWVDSLISEFSTQPTPPPPPPPPPLPQEHFTDPSMVPAQNHAATTGSWVDGPATQQQQNLGLGLGQLPLVAAVEEDSGIRLVQLLMTCAEAVQRGELHLAGSLIEEMQALLARVNTVCGIGKVAGYFIDALRRRIFSTQGLRAGTAQESEILFHFFYEACPCLKFAHFTANQAILEAFNGHDCVHVVDFNLMHGLQWPALIQALALRPGGPPMLRLTGIGPPSPDGRDSLREVGLRLAELARSVNVRFAFRGVAASRLEDVRPWMLQVSPKEALAINSIMQLHRLLAAEEEEAPGRSPPIEGVLEWIRGLNPKIVMVVEQEADHNRPAFLERFTEALYYYSTMFDSLESCPLQPEKALAEMYIQREICNVLCCEGWARVERHEPLDKWRARLGRAGFRPLHLGSNAFKQASMLLSLSSADGFCVEENDGCLTLGWHSRPLIAASAWQAAAPHLL